MLISQLILINEKYKLFWDDGCKDAAVFYFLCKVSRYHSYLNSASKILQQYRGDEPFASFLKKYFSANKKFGSKDRKQVSNLCYCFFRLGKTIMNATLEEKILTGLFLCSTKSNDILGTLKPDWNEKCEVPVHEKLSIINPPAGRAGSSFLLTHVFPWKDELSDGIDHEKFCESFLVQPDLFLRLRPGKENIIKQKLLLAGIEFEIISHSCLALPNSSKIDEIIELDNEAVIQDYNSQKTGEIIKPAIVNLPAGSQYRKTEISLWDCCAGSGGKSIMVCDIKPGIELTVSDSRESILANLKKRFEKAGIKNYKSFVTNLDQDKSEIVNLPAGRQGLKSEIIIADVPCSGSGTWGRTPEQLYFFNANKIDEHSALQKKIVSNVIPHLQPGGLFVYITCSVFKKENEEVVEFIKEKFKLQLKQTGLLKGYDKKADTMFIAVFNSSVL